MRCLLLAFLVWQIPLAAAEPVIELNAILGKQVIITVNGEQVKLREGETHDDGLKLVEVTRKDAKFEWQGETFTIEPSSRVGTQFTESTKKVITINRHANGHYFAKGEINGYPVDFIVDTGASDIALTAEQASAIGIRWENAPTVTYITANGKATGYSVQLERVTVGGVTVNLVEAGVNPGNQQHHALLGMSFLKHFDMRESNNILTLTRKY